MKKRSFHKLLLMMMAAIMVFSMTACKGDDSQTSTKDIDTSEHVKLTLLVLGTKPTNGRLEAMLEKLNEILTDKVNAELAFQYVAWADWQTQYNLQLASGSSDFDLITTATDWLFAWQNTKKGAFLPLTDEMLQTYAPKTWESVPPENWDACRYEGTIYFMPEDNYAQYTNHGVFYRGDWADELGVGTVDNFEELGKYFQGIIDHKEGVIPWDASGTGSSTGLLPGYMIAYTKNIVIPAAMIGNFEILCGASAEDPWTLTSPYMEGDTLLNAAKMFKQWSDAGYWREDVLNYEGTTRDLFYAGLSGADQHHSMTYYSQVRPNMDIHQPGSDARMFSFSEPSKNLVKTSITHGAMAINASSKNPERALMVYDLLRYDKECHLLINYGIEGEDYIITEDGKLDRPEGFDATTDSLGSNFWAGRNDDLILDEVSWWDGKNDLIAHYETYAVDDPYGRLILNTEKISAKISAMSDVCANYLPLIGFGKVDDPEAIVKEFQEAMLAAGYQEVFDEIQAQMNEVKNQK